MKWMLTCLYALCMTATAQAENAYISVAPRPIFSMTSPVTVANTVAETSMLGVGVGTLVLPANYLIAGRTLKLWMMGRRSTSGNPTERLQLKLDGVTVLDSGTVTSGSATNEIWECRALITVRTTGISGTSAANGFYMEESGTGNNNIFGLVNTGAMTINTTIAHTIGATWTWGVASTLNTITDSNLVIELSQ